MIFCSKNEDDIPAWKLVKARKKTVTRRVKPETIGAIRAVCPGRGKHAVCKIKILDCYPAKQWDSFHRNMPKALKAEAKREGFKSWAGLMGWFLMKYGTIPDGLWRIEFKVVKG